MKSKIRYSTIVCISLVLTALVLEASASTTKVFSEKSFGDFSRGELKTTSLSSEGKIFPGPGIEKIWEEGPNDLVWRIITAQKNILYFSTGNEGKIYKAEGKNKAELFCDLEEVAAFALAVDDKGVLFAGASPGGKIYRIQEKDKPTVFFETGQEYVWDLVFDKQGNLFAATGKEGKLFKIKQSGEGEVYYQAPDKNLLDILFLEKVADDSLYVATHDKGKIYRVYEKDKAFVLYDSGMDEVRSIVEGEKGYLFAGLNSLKTPPPPPPPQKKPEPEAKETEEPEGEDKEEPEKMQLGMPFFLGKKSAIIKLDMAGYVWQLLSSSESPIHSLAYDSSSKTLFAALGEKGKLYQVEDLNKYTIVCSSEEKYILSLANVENGLLFGTGQAPRLYQITWKDRSKGEYISSVHDAGTAVEWGRMRLQADLFKGTGVQVSTRSGNTGEPDKTWSEWTKEEEFKEGQALISCPVARFMQYKLLLSGDKENIYPVVKQMDSYYLPPNRAPEIESIDVAPPGKPKAPPKPPEPKEKEGEKQEGNTGKSEAGANIDTLANSNPKKVQINWKVRDPENDKLRFSLFFKGEEEKIWKKIDDKLDKTNFTLPTDALPDGRYQIRVIASDVPTNPKPTARETELVSEPFTIDNTPPRIVKDLSFERVGKKDIVIHAAVEDDTSIISSAQYSLNADEWFRVNPEDEIFDSRKESFTFLISDVEPEEILVTFMVTDAEGNTVVSKLLIKSK